MSNGRQSVPLRIAACPRFASRRARSAAVAAIVPIRCDLALRRHLVRFSQKERAIVLPLVPVTFKSRRIRRRGFRLPRFARAAQDLPDRAPIVATHHFAWLRDWQ